METSLYDFASYHTCPLCYNIVLYKENVIKEYGKFILAFNKDPYTPNSMILVSKRHVADLSKMSFVEKFKFSQILSEIQCKLLEHISDSINIGINTGPYAGGSIPSHFHAHIVIRRKDDINFMNLINRFALYRDHHTGEREKILSLF